MMPLQNVSKIDEQYESLKEDEHILHLWEPLKFEINKDYKYFHTGFFFTIFSNLLYAIAYPILIIINKIFFGFKVEKKENYKKVKTGKITISNHVHFMDCTMIGVATMPQKTFFTSLASNFKIPIVKTLITLFNTIPIPNKISNKKYFIDAINSLLKQNKSIHFYPEGSLWPYYTKLRHFKNGAFEFAVYNNIPIIPCVFKFENPKGIRKYIKKKPFVKLIYLEPIYPNNLLTSKEAVIDLKERCYKKMKEELEN